MTETQLANNSEEVENILTPLSLHTNNLDEHIYSNTAVALNKNQIQLLNAHNIPGATLYSFKHSMVNFPINIMLLYRQQNLENDHFLYKIRHWREIVEKTNIILGDFNKNYFTAESSFLKEYLEEEYEMIVKEPTHISGSLIDHVYVHKDLKTEFETQTSIRSIYFSDHDAIQVKFKALF